MMRQPTRSAAPLAAPRVWSGQLELTAPALPEQPLLCAEGEPFDEARLLIRVHGVPAGFVQVPLWRGRVLLDSVRQVAERDLAAAVAQLGRHDEPAPRVAEAQPRVTVVVCTRNRAEQLRSCLDSLRRLRTHPHELLVVDNAPDDDSTERVVRELSHRERRLRYLREDRPGLSRARNRALRGASGEILAFTDDDVCVDPLWLEGVIRGFARRGDVACVTGLVASVSLERPAEQYFDRRVWWSSSCEHRLYTAQPGPDSSPAHPYASGRFGTGANAAFRADAIRAIGGFDESLGAGSPSSGGEDLDAFVRILRAGLAISYEPGALVWHAHRVDDTALRGQMYGYGLGLSAYLFKYLLSPRTRGDLLRRLLPGIRHGFRLRRRSRAAALSAGAPTALARAELRGLLSGPAAYLKGRSRQSSSHTRAVAP